MKVYKNKDGTLEQNKCSIQTVPQEQLRIVEECAIEVERRLGGLVKSTYLYGGLAQGKRDPRYSDLDMMLFFDDELGATEMATVLRLQEVLTNQYRDDFAYVWLDCATPRLYVEEQPLVYGLLAKSLWIHLGGKNMSDALPDVPLDKKFGWQLNGDFPERIAKKYIEFSQSQSHSEKKLACRWIMKKLLRTSFGLIVEKVDYFENDIDWLAEVLAQFFPEKANILEQIRQLVHTPTLDNDIVAAILDSYLTWLQSRWRMIYDWYGAMEKITS